MYFLPLYIDPGTGSMLFTILIGVAAAALYALKGLKIKLMSLLKGGRAAKAADRDKLPYVIYTDSKRYWNVFKPICDEFEQRKLSLTYLTQSEDDPVFRAGYTYVKPEFIGEGNKGFARLNLLKAGTVLSTTPGLEVYQWKRSKGVDRYVHIFHDASEGTGYRMFGLDFYDEVLLTGSLQEGYIRKLEGLRGLPAKKLQVVGSTYLDAMAARRDTLPATEKKQEKPLILLAPSWGPSSILNRYGEKILRALVETGYAVAVRPHPQMKTSDGALLQKLRQAFPENESFSWNFDNDNFDILSRADLMITDFSGVMNDYALVFDRPLVYAETDLDLSPYDASWIEEPLWRLEILPLLGKQLQEGDFPRMKEVLDSVMAEDCYRRGREQVREEIWQNRGLAAKTAVDYLTEAENDR